MAIYACSDLHGQLELWNRIKEYLTSKDVLYFLGDAIDRGEGGWTIVDEMMDMYNVCYIKGNHEEMALDVFNAILHNHIKTEDEFSISRSYNRWVANGGGQKKCPFDLLKDRDRLQKYVDFFEKTAHSTAMIEVNGKTIALDHSGYAIGIDFPFGGRQLYWNRDHFNYSWNEEEEFKNVYLVHGHTPTYFFDVKPRHMYSRFPYYAFGYNSKNVSSHEGYIPKVMRYADDQETGHKFNIDMGSFFTGVAVLLNLDTFEEIYFNEKGRV